jgi:hypothetical protein
MAVFAIPNPKKSLTVDFPIEQVKKGVNNLYLIGNKYKFTSSNEVFNQYTFEALELLSLGVFIDINLTSINENRTEITIEIRRKIGTFDQSHEVTKANNHIQSVIEILSKSIILNDEQINELQQLLKSNNENKEIKGKKGRKRNQIIIFGILILIIILINYANRNNSNTDSKNNNADSTKIDSVIEK